VRNECSGRLLQSCFSERHQYAPCERRLWRADITYGRLREEFVFLAVILDAFSRRVIGWALDRNMEDELTLTALRIAMIRLFPVTAISENEGVHGEGSSRVGFSI
jgi:transposase InsO family protein